MDIHKNDSIESSRYAALPEYPDDSESPILGRRPFTHHPANMADKDAYRSVSDNDKGETKLDSNPSKTHGLGLGNIVGRPSQIKRVPAGITRSTTMDGLLSPATLSPANFARVPSYENVSIGDVGARSAEFYIPSHQSSTSNLGPPTPGTFNSDMGLLGSPRKVDAACPTHSDILTSPWSWISVPLLFLALYSTAFSGIFLGIALAKPRWGDKVGTNGHLSFANASLLSAIFSKTVEISFVTVFVALLGQVLTRRAFSKRDGTGGISIAEMNMRTWIMQPGSLLVNLKAVRYANSFLGAIVLISAFSATWYTTASEALVSPKLKFGPIQDRTISGLVSASYANAMYLGTMCEVPVAEANDDFEGSTCLQIRHAGMGFSYLSSFLRDWAESVAAGNTTESVNGFEGRPLPVAVLYDNTTINGQWITPSQENITTDSSSHGRLVENVTMAMPHAGIFKAVRDPANRILQPADLQGSGEYVVQASLPAPIVNILCVGLSTEEMSPMIVNVTDPTTYVPNATVVDSIFGWDPNAEAPSTPYFPKLPIEYNTIVHIPSVWGPPAISLLATPPKGTTTNDHVLCTIKSALYRNCTTWYKVAQSGGLLTVHCDADERNTLPYHRTRPDAPIGEWNSDWKDIGGEWIRSLALNNGVSDANASSARLLTQYIPEYNRDAPTILPTTKPTIGEAIGVLAGGTLLLSSLDAPYEHTWNYSETVLAEPQRQSFPSMYTYKDYASGGTQGWQGIFYVILTATFLLSAAALGYLCWNFIRQGNVTDYTEPQNLFALAVNSPSSSALYGACGGGPKGETMARKWTVDMIRTDNDHDGFQYQPLTSSGRHPHFFIRCKDEELSPMMNNSSPSTPYTTYKPHSKRGKFRSSRPPTMNESWSAGSPVVEQYQRLAGGKP